MSLLINQLGSIYHAKFTGKHSNKMKTQFHCLPLQWKIFLHQQYIVFQIHSHSENMYEHKHQYLKQVNTVSDTLREKMYLNEAPTVTETRPPPNKTL